jgi:DNA-directed RNA polymerase specialized sigma24 family protein
MSTSARSSARGRLVVRAATTPAELEGFYRELFMPLVRRATWTHGLKKEDARDVVQEAFVLALAKLDSRGNPKAWLIQVVDHLSVNHIRKGARRARLTAKWGGGLETGNRFDSEVGRDSDDEAPE